MIRIQVRLRGAVLRGLEASGHAHYGVSGNDMACASVSAVIRSVCMGLETIPGIVLDGGAEQEGEIRLDVTRIPDNYQQEVCGITRVLLLGLEGLQRDFPGSLTVEVVRTE
ncbi:MAG: ribosomal-processing cysteine protease Prp [Spirochaetales bacterium]|nr:ribosomal-processing cysteine protease Prp [Spirochaetales bacterium]